MNVGDDTLPSRSRQAEVTLPKDVPNAWGASSWNGKNGAAVSWLKSKSGQRRYFASRVFRDRAGTKPLTEGVPSVDVDANLREYLEGRKPNERYASFDYCFNYFQSFRESRDVSALVSPVNIQISCLQLGFYLASWGMFRGSAELLQKSARSLIHVLEVVAHTETSLWELDAHCYTESNINRLMELASTIRQAQPSMSDTLVTKIMLGVFGNVPAFDANFKRGFGVATFGPKALRKVGGFFQAHAQAINAYCVPTLDFISGEPTQRNYPRAKVIDMAFFIEGLPSAEPVAS